MSSASEFKVGSLAVLRQEPLCDAGELMEYEHTNPYHINYGFKYNTEYKIIRTDTCRGRCDGCNGLPFSVVDGEERAMCGYGAPKKWFDVVPNDWD